jgi:hypothetical protein
MFKVSSKLLDLPFNIMVASSYKVCLWCQNWPHPGGHRFPNMEKNILGTSVSVQICWKLVRKVAMMISRAGSNMGHLGSKTGHTSLIWRNLAYTLETIVLVQMSYILVKNVVKMISSSIGIGQKLRSYSPNIEKP